MTEYFKPRHKNDLTREAIIGLGEDSFRKNYYPELKDKLMDLERINIRNRALMTTIPDILLVSDVEGHISPFTISIKKDNPIILEILRSKPIITQLRAAIAQVVEKRDLEHSHFTLEMYQRTYYFEARIHISELEEILIMIRDITDQVIMEMKLRDMAQRDSLTNLYNRRSFEEKLEAIEGTAHQRLALISIDIDGLKLVNDTLGHLAGDDIIIAVAKAITTIFGEFAFISRINGDEFIVIIEGMSQKEIETHLDALKDYVKAHNLDNSTIAISLSNGYAYHKEGPINTKYLFQEADNNMYQNKLLKEGSVRNNIVKTLMKTLEAKDYITEGHADRMEFLAIELGHRLGSSQNEIDRIVLLTKFHDIGKVGIPDSILKKPGTLTEDEWKVMRTHSNIGERIAAESSELREIAPLILRHHEKWDGTGYPVGLAGEDIPLECRILSIVDAFDAMTNDRPYRLALSVERAMEEIAKCSGGQFDPVLVGHFMECVRKNYE